MLMATNNTLAIVDRNPPLWMANFLAKRKPARFYQSEKKVHALGIVFIALAIIALSVFVYFGLNSNFTDPKIMGPGASSLAFLACGMILSLKKEFKNDRFYNLRKEVEEYDKTREAEFLKIKNLVQGTETIMAFSEACKDFCPIGLFEGHMNRFFEVIDQDGEVRKMLRKNTVKCLTDSGFNEFGKECQILTKRIGWSYLDLVEQSMLKDKLKEFLENSSAIMKDLENMCKDYWDIAKPLLPPKVLQDIDLKSPDRDLLFKNWQHFAASKERRLTEIL